MISQVVFPPPLAIWEFPFSICCYIFPHFWSFPANPVLTHHTEKRKHHILTSSPKTLKKKKKKKKKQRKSSKMGKNKEREKRRKKTTYQSGIPSVQIIPSFVIYHFLSFSIFQINKLKSLLSRNGIYLLTGIKCAMHEPALLLENNLGHKGCTPY